MIEKIYYKKTLIGIRLLSTPKGSYPHTKPNQALGFLTLSHPKGTYLRAHIHKKMKRENIGRLQECFIVIRGKVRIDLFGPDKKFFKYIFLKEGQMFLSINGGHGFTFLKDSLVFEVKHGPYFDDKVFIEK